MKIISGDCLEATFPCACTRETGAAFAYIRVGCLKEEFLQYDWDNAQDKEKHVMFCASGWHCSIERSKNPNECEGCKGHMSGEFIKECWHKCGCSMGCGNRFIQRGIMHKLQIFFTHEGKRWGLRTLEQLPAGAFVCKYVGEILTNMEQEERNNNAKADPTVTHTYPILSFWMEIDGYGSMGCGNRIIQRGITRKLQVRNNDTHTSGHAKGGAGRRRHWETSSSSTSGTSQTGCYDSDQNGDESAAPSLPQRSRLDAARLPVTCHCAKCKGMMTKTAIEAERHIQQWGRHDEGESSRAASDRRGEVQSRSRPAIRDILRHRFIQFSMTAIQDFSTQLRTSRARTPMPQPVDSEVFRRALETLDISALFTSPTSVPASLAVPRPDLARHAQPELEVERQVDPVVAPVVEPEVEPTINVESHHPSTEIHGVVGELIMVVERYVAPHRDDDTSGTVYSHDEWLVLVGAHPTGFRTYLLDVDS
ncbi:hypothetical protein R1sor_012700 [Riccia sorocarpa]|uniref:Uncharacterized protein n=1 Tax=Riccia sorocarpa TaxID=122646 RepID=A0ABD3I7W2_9MARC